jgi:hypothetical protein
MARRFRLRLPKGAAGQKPAVAPAVNGYRGALDMAGRKFKWSMKKFIDNRRKWLTLASDDQELATLQKSLADTSTQPIVLTDSYSRFAVRQAAHGIVQIAEGEHRGWQGLYHHFQAAAWDFYVQSAVVDDQTRHNRPLWQGLLLDPYNFRVWLYCFAFSLCIDHPFAAWSTQRLLRAITSDSDPWIEPGDVDNHYSTYLTRLGSSLAAAKLTELPEGARQLPTYAAIFHAWDNQTALTDAINAACDFHCQECREEVGAFESVQPSLIPVDILVLYSVRARLGLPTPQVSHPILEPPFAKLSPDSVAGVPRHPLHEKVIERCRRLVPGLDLEI